MSTILDRIVAHKRTEILEMPDISESELKKSNRDFALALRRQSEKFPRLIAEIKPKSPSAGTILPPDFSVTTIAEIFEKNNVVAISVLTDAKFFGGSFENLALAKSATSKTPILCKDFILSRKQVRLARKFGADSILLIAKILSRAELAELLEYARTFGMEPLIEIADEEDLEKIKDISARVVGINNRNLYDFSLDLFRTFSLAKKLPPGTTVASLSGFSGADVRFIRTISDAVLVGSSIGKSENIAKKLTELSHPSLLKKFCGVRKFSDFEMAQQNGAYIFGLNFVETSRRQISEREAIKIAGQKRETKLFGVFQNASRKLCREKCEKFRLDFCQLHGTENPEEFRNFPRPIVRAIRISDDIESILIEMRKWDDVADIWLFDGKNPGSGEIFPFEIFDQIRNEITKPFFVAGGITPENFVNMAKKCDADGIDTASGIENSAGEWNAAKIRAMR